MGSSLDNLEKMEPPMLAKDAATSTLLSVLVVPSIPPVKFSLATRSGYGGKGNQIFLLANHYRVHFQNKELFHYDVNIDLEPPKGCSYSVIMETFNQHGDTLNNAIPAYNGDKSLYTAKPLDHLVELDVVLSDGGKSNPSSAHL